MFVSYATEPLLISSCLCIGTKFLFFFVPLLSNRVFFCCCFALFSTFSIYIFAHKSDRVDFVVLSCMFTFAYTLNRPANSSFFSRFWALHCDRKEWSSCFGTHYMCVLYTYDFDFYGSRCLQSKSKIKNKEINSRAEMTFWCFHIDCVSVCAVCTFSLLLLLSVFFPFSISVYK